MKLLYFALLCEAQYFIEKLKATKVNSTPKIYQFQDILLVIGGVGKENTIKSLEFIFNNFNIDIAINIGVAGSSTKKYKIGDIFSITKKVINIPKNKLFTTTTPISDINDDTLIDMEGEFFYNFCIKKIDENNIYILKIVSDYLDVKSLNKDFVKKLIIKNYKIIINFLDSNL